MTQIDIECIFVSVIDDATLAVVGAQERVGEFVARSSEFLQWVASPDPAVLAQVLEPDEITTRILRGAFEQFVLTGVRRTTMEDVARRSGVSRASLYRRFPSKAQLNAAIVIAETARYLEESARISAASATFEESMVQSTIFNVKFIREHILLKHLLLTEPEAILPSLTTEADPLIALATERSITELAAALYGDAPMTGAQERHLRTVAELQTRLTLSFILTPKTSIDLDSPDAIRAFVRDYLLPMTTAAIPDNATP